MYTSQSFWDRAIEDGNLFFDFSYPVYSRTVSGRIVTEKGRPLNFGLFSPLFEGGETLKGVVAALVGKKPFSKGGGGGRWGERLADLKRSRWRMHVHTHGLVNTQAHRSGRLRHQQTSSTPVSLSLVNIYINLVLHRFCCLLCRLSALSLSLSWQRQDFFPSSFWEATGEDPATGSEFLSFRQSVPWRMSFGHILGVVHETVTNDCFDLKARLQADFIVKVGTIVPTLKMHLLFLFLSCFSYILFTLYFSLQAVAI